VGLNLFYGIAVAAQKMGFLDKELLNASFAIAVIVETHHKGKRIFHHYF